MAEWPGGPAAYWYGAPVPPSAPVTKWPGGPAAYWYGAPVARRPGGPVARRWPLGLLGQKPGERG